MSDDTIRLATVGRILHRRRRLLAVLVVVGALVGYGASLLFPPSYTTTASVLLPGQWEERELLTQAEIATSSQVLDRTAAALRWSGVDGPGLRDRVSVAPADGNIIKISGTAATPARAQQLADRMAQQFVDYAARLAGDDPGPEAAAGPETLRKQVAQTNRRISELADAADPGRTVESVQARTELEKLRTALQESLRKLEQADPATDRATMVVMGPSARPTGQAPPTRTQLVAGGALVFLLLAVVGHLAAARVDRRPRTGPEIAAALGSELLGTVDVPGERRTPRPREHGARSRLRRLLGADTRWDLPTPRVSGDEGSRRVRYRRVCVRLRTQLPAARGFLVVVPEGDEIARRAAGQLVSEAAGDPSGTSTGRGYPALRVAEVSTEQPLVPDRELESGALVVLSAGNWTTGELSGVAEACADAGHDVVGVVVADPVRARPAPAAVPAPRRARTAVSVGDDARGGRV
ncbi:polysaccharide biosynthesis protein [Streptomyces sp. NPDC006552]|uniref:polysaccharide biosynthesis protein n=1 Tax=Streptomyces sp. NPDC006552 TaxID=3157179 RepID=UPI0033A2B407